MTVIKTSFGIVFSFFDAKRYFQLLTATIILFYGLCKLRKRFRNVLKVTFTIRAYGTKSNPKEVC